MIGTMTGGVPAFGLCELAAEIQARTADVCAATKQAAAAAQKRDQAALDVLVNGTEESRRQRKADAAQKVAQLKDEIEHLWMFSGGDPKAMARRVADMARQLSAAAEDYGADKDCLGGAGDSATNAASADGAVVSAAATVAADPVTPDGTTADAVTPDGTTADAVTPDGTTADAVTSDGNTGEAAGDAGFASDVRGLATWMVAAIEHQKTRAAEQKHDDAEMDNLVRTVKEAAAGIRGSLTVGVVEVVDVLV